MKQGLNYAQRESHFETTLCLTDQEEIKQIQQAMQKMTVFPLGAGEYELLYDTKTDNIVVVRVFQKYKQERYFMTKDDAYACILLIGESRMKHYLKARGKLC